MVGYEVKQDFELFEVGQLVKESDLPADMLADLMAEGFVRPVGEYEVLAGAAGAVVEVVKKKKKK